jgi:hypothetical protein
MHRELRKAIADTPRDNLTFPTTAFGKGFTVAGFGDWFRDACDDAGLKGGSAHGLCRQQAAVSPKLALQRCKSVRSPGARR